MERLEKVPTPFTATTVVVPDSVPTPGLFPIATVMLAVELVTVLSKASRTVTRTAGERATPAVVFDGWTVNASLAAAAGVMVKVVEVAPVRPAEAAASV